ncbi:MAG: sensor histidine kinase [bacterium]
MLGTQTHPTPQAPPAGLLGRALAAIVTDDRGLVCAVSPQLAELGLDISPERIGRHWTELLPSFRRLPVSATSGDDDFVVLLESDRSAFRITRFPLLGGTDTDGGALLLVRPVEMDGDGKNVAARYLDLLCRVTEQVGHEINNALTTITGWTEMLLADAQPDDPAHEPLSTIAEELDRIRDIACTLVEYGKEPRAESELLEVNDVARTVVEFLRLQAKQAGVTVETELRPGVGAVEGNAGQLKQAFLNLMLNALAAMPEGGELRVATGRSDDGSRAEIRFMDTGHGIPREAVHRIFDVHFTTRADRGGTGIGLALSRDIVRQMGGELELEETSAAGSRFVIRLPLAGAA